jgi:NAD(P)-dependent dehydrogenase (short-subunit alcohol dehydrogenase family)
MSEQHSALITGSNSGFGRRTAELFLEHGWRVFATMRNVDGANAAAAAELRAKGATIVELDVTNDASVEAAAATVLADATPDVIVNNAGAAYFGVVEAFTPALAEQQFAINVFGPLRVNRAFLPAMRARGSGLVVFVSSVVGRLTLPVGGVYAASKWALEALAESSALELKPLGIDVAIVQPGAYPTEIGAKGAGADDTARTQAYGETAQRFAETIFGALGAASQGRDPGEVAEAIYRIAALPAGRRPLRVTVPHDEFAESVNAAGASAQQRFLEALGMGNAAPV